MKLIDLLRNKQFSVYQCAKESQIPYTTLSDLVKGKTSLENCTAVTLYKLSKTLHVAMEELLEECFREQNFEIYKSNVCHLVISISSFKLPMTEFIFSSITSSKIFKIIGFLSPSFTRRVERSIQF